MASYTEREALRAFTAGRATFMRNWPYAMTLLDASRGEVRNDYEVAPLPAFAVRGRPGGVLARHDLVVSSSTDNAPAAMALVDFLSREQALEKAAIDWALPSPVGAA